MSTDYDAACFTCRRVHHIGQRMASTYSFGWGSHDAEGRAQVWEWLTRHLEPEWPAEPHDVRILPSDCSDTRGFEVDEPS